MRKGHSFEKQIQKLLDAVNAMGFHAHKNHPQRLADGTYIQGEPFDYEMMLPGYLACFDAKESHELVWHIRDKDIGQAERLKHCKNAGADAFFLIYFYPLKDYRKMDVDDIIRSLGEGKKSIGAELGSRWDISDRLRCAKDWRDSYASLS